jgi:hypothetical protein
MNGGRPLIEIVEVFDVHGIFSPMSQTADVAQKKV